MVVKVITFLVSDFDETLLIISSEKIKSGVVWLKKTFRNSLETSIIISSEKIIFRILAVLCKTYSIGKKSNFKFQNRGYFGKINIPPSS